MDGSTLHNRHAGHGKTNNVKYGYIILLCTVMAMCLLSIKNSAARRYAQNHRWLFNPPLWVTIMMWSAFLVFFSFFNLHPDGIVGIAKRAGR